MKLLVVVLALATLALAEPEADPAYLYRGFYGHPHLGQYWGHGYGYLGYRGYYGRSAYGYSGPGNSYTHVDRLHKREADAQVALPAGLIYNGAIAPAAFAPLTPYAYPTAFPTALTAAVTDVTHIAPEVSVAATPFAASPYFAPYAAPVVPAAVGLTPHDCVTATGCQVAALKLAGLAKREATAEPEAEAEAEAQADASAYYSRYYGYRPYSYYGYYNGFYNNPYRYGGYYGGYGGYPYAAPYTYPVAAAPAPVAPVVKSVPVAPVRPARPVTYTHLGAHPIHPTTVLEEF